MKAVKTLTLLTICVASLALADDFKTVTGREYKNASISRVEPDGIMVKYSGGLVKIPFTELSEELKEKYHYNPEEAQKFRTESAAAINALNGVVAANTKSGKKEENPERLLQQVRIFAIIKPYFYGKEETTAYIQEYQNYWIGPTAYDFEWRKVGKEFTGAIDERMPEHYEEGDAAVVTLYRVGHSNDSIRHPLFTMDKEKAMQLVLGGR
jgi:hypothetical protein